MKEEIKVFEFDSVSQAENEYFKRREEGCWQIVSCLKLSWSWKRLRNVATFSMKKVEKAYHFDDYMRDTHNCILAGISVLKDVSETMGKVNKIKREKYLPTTCKDKEREKNDPCKFPIGSCFLCQNPF